MVKARKAYNLYLQNKVIITAYFSKHVKNQGLFFL